MAKYFPDTIDSAIVRKAFGTEDNYNDLQVKYRNCLEELFNSIIDFTKINEKIKNSGIAFKEIDDDTYNIYHKDSKLNCPYIFIRNNMHIENLSSIEINALKNNKLYESFITDTIEKVLKEPEDFLAYGPNKEDLKFTDGIIFEFAYDSNDLSEEEKAKAKKLIDEIFKILASAMEESSFVTNFIIYDKNPDYFRPTVKNRSSILKKMKVVKSINDYTIDDQEEFKENLPTKEYHEDTSINPETAVKLKALTDVLEQKDTNKEIASSDIMDAVALLQNSGLPNEPKEEVVEEQVVEKTATEVANVPNTKVTRYYGLIENKPFTLRYVISFKSNNVDRILNLYDFSLNGKHAIYYTDLDITECVNNNRTKDIDLLFTLDTIREARSYNTSYIGTVVNGQAVIENGIEDYYYNNKVIPRENGYIVAIDNGTVISGNKRLYSYNLLSLSTDQVVNIVTETDIFSNINSDEELAEFLSDRNIINSIRRNGYIGNLLPDGTITYGGE